MPNRRFMQYYHIRPTLKRTTYEQLKVAVVPVPSVGDSVSEFQESNRTLRLMWVLLLLTLMWVLLIVPGVTNCMGERICFDTCIHAVFIFSRNK